MTNLFSSINPATGEILWKGEAASAALVDATVKKANEAYKHWSMTSIEERIRLLQHYVAILKEQRPQIANLIAQEMGKVRREADAEAGALISKVTLSIEAYHQRTGEVSAEMDGGIRRMVTHRPIGVMAVFGPYNFPMHLPNGHMVPALLAGNCVILKPSEETPKCGELLVSLMQQAGFPEGVVSLLQGSRETGVALTTHPDIAGILFTGSYATGKKIHEALAGKPHIMLALEMGGNNPLIVHEIDQVEAAAKMIVDSAYATTGQRCTCARRLIVPIGQQGNTVVDALTSCIDRITVGSAFAENEPYMGPLVNNMQVDNVLQAQAMLLAKGGRIIRESKRLHEKLPFLSAGLVETTAAHDVPDEEVFGPLLQLVRVRDLDEAIHEANRTAYGLAAGLLSDKAGNWDYVYPRLRAGIVNYNRPLTGAASASPFGGPGKSGNYRPSAYYAADYCAYPVATLASDVIADIQLVGLQ